MAPAFLVFVEACYVKKRVGFVTHFLPMSGTGQRNNAL